MKKLLSALSVLLLLMLVVFIYFYRMLFIPNITTGENKKIYVYVEDKMTIDDFVKEEVVKSSFFINKESFLKAADFLGIDVIRPGRYLVADNMSNRELLSRLKQGIQQPLMLSFNNIRTKEQLAGTLSTKLRVDSLSILNVLNDNTFLAPYGLNENTSVAVFIPNTYEVYWTITAEALFKKMWSEYEKFWNDERTLKAEQAKLTKIEVSTLASIIEEETNKKSEKPVIAGLYMNRLKKGMPLQACPTIKFANNDFTIQRVLDKHLTVESPYNTYIHKGLPPGPIRIPSIESIDAVLNYDKNNYLYMTAKDDFSGENVFSSSYAEHTRNAVKYHKALNQRRIYK